MCHRVCVLYVCVRTGVCKCACVQGQLEICCWTTVLDLLTNHLNSLQAGASLSVCESQLLMSSFHAVLRSLARWRCRFTILLLQICVFRVYV